LKAKFEKKKSFPRNYKEEWKIKFGDSCCDFKENFLLAYLGKRIESEGQSSM
jgi:hypothetical protein